MSTAETLAQLVANTDQLLQTVTEVKETFQDSKDTAVAAAADATNQVVLATEQASLATTQAGNSLSSANTGLVYRNEAQTFRNEAAATVGEPLNPLVEHINHTVDLLSVLQKDALTIRNQEAIVHVLQQISDLAGVAAKILSGSGEYKASAGSATRCAIQHVSTPGTGIFFPAANEIAFAINGTEVLRIDSGGIVP